jgi:transposase
MSAATSATSPPVHGRSSPNGFPVSWRRTPDGPCGWRSSWSGWASSSAERQGRASCARQRWEGSWSVVTRSCVQCGAPPCLTALPAQDLSPLLSVDDFSFRRGRTFGTILVDLAKHRVVDLLPEATAEAFATWLRAHPGVQIISRDRGGVYAEGARHGAPQAVQVADRFHLLKNLLEALDRVLLRQHTLLAEVFRDLASETAPPRDRCSSTRASTRAEGDARVREARRRARYDAVVAAQASGVSLHAIARTLGLARNTVRRYVRGAVFPGRSHRPARMSKVARFSAYLQTRWEAGEHTSALLFREIAALGYRGSASTLRHVLASWRHDSSRIDPPPPTRSGQPSLAPPRPYTPRQTRWLLVDAIKEPDARACAYRDAVLACSPEIRLAHVMVKDFLRLVQTRDACALPAWLVQAEASSIAELAGFARGLRRDLPAVEAALLVEHSQGQIEGQVNRLKLLKRQMYGRAKFDLLRQRVLYQPSC